MPLPDKDDDTFTLFKLDEYNHYLMLAKRDYKDIDTHILEYLIASYLIYDIKGITRPDENNEEFIRVENKFKELLEKERLEKERLEKEEKEEKEE